MRNIFATLVTAIVLGFGIVSTAVAADTDRSKCELKDSTPADAGYKSLKVQRPSIGAKMTGFRIEAQIDMASARLSAADATLKVASVLTCKDESGKEAVRWVAYSQPSPDGNYDVVELPIPGTAKAFRIRSCSSMQGAQCFSGTFDGDFSKPVVLTKEEAATKK